MLHNLNDLLKSIAYCLGVAWKTSKIYTIVRLLGNFMIPIFSIVLSYFVKLILDLLVIKEGNAISQVIILLTVTLTITLLSNFVQRFSQHVMVVHDSIIQNYINLSIMDQAVSADLSLYDNAQFYDKLAAVRKESYSLSSILWNVLDCISALFALISSIVILAQYSIAYAISMLLLVIPMTLVNQFYTKKIYLNDLSQTSNERKRDYIFMIGSAKEYAQEIRCWNLGGLLKEKYLSLWDAILHTRKELSYHQTLLVFLLSILPEVAACIISIRIANQVFQSNISVGDYSFYTGMLMQILSGTMLFLTYIINVYDNKLKIEHMRTFSNQYCRSIENGTYSIKQIRKIEFRDVCFRYPGKDDYAIDHVSFVVNQNQIVVLVGKNGSGKSTLIKLLFRFYDVTSGVILINDINIRNYRIEDLRCCIGAYFQNSPNFAFTINENIILNRTQNAETQQHIQNLLLTCGGKDILSACHLNLNAYLTRIFSEDGLEFSEGQHQKIAIVRALYSNSSTLVLDEPASSLDPEAEHQIFEYLREISHDKLILLTSHRLSNAYLADRVIVIENGHILEEGTRSELLSRKDSRFAELYNYQAKKFQSAEDLNKV